MQLLLFAFESICPIVRGTGYSAADSTVSRRFFELELPEWLDRVETWAYDEGFANLSVRVGRARELYGSIASAIVKA